MTALGLSATMSHRWKFFRAGGFDQVLIDSPDDLQALNTLDPKLWVALSCPTSGLYLDPRTMEFVDTDNDGHIRVPEILGAIDWAGKRLKNLELLLKGEDGFFLSSIKDDSEEGLQLIASAKTILRNLERKQEEWISIEDASSNGAQLSSAPFNGDGIITESSTDDENIQSWIRDIISCCGSVTDRSGAPGINKALLEDFSSACSAWLKWRDEISSNNDFGNANPEPFFELWDHVREKIEDYFLRCRMANYDPRAGAAMNASDETLAWLGTKRLPDHKDEMAQLPLAYISADRTLDLETNINPAWASKIRQFRTDILVQILGVEVKVIGEQEWETVRAHCAVFEEWWNARISTPVSALGMERLQGFIRDGIEEKLQQLIERDLELQPAYEAIIEVEKLARFCRDLYTLINNFVSFRDFYTKRQSMFQAGTLYLDGRSCELCIMVGDPSKHMLLASLSRVFLVYCECTRSDGAEKINIVAAITSGDSDQIIIGRNGIFYDRKGHDWDATVIRIVDHPISMRQAFWSPYKRIIKMAGEQLQKIAAARSKTAEEKVLLHAIKVGTQTDKGPDKAVATPPFDAGKFAGIFAAIGLAIGAIGTAFASIVTGFLKLSWWQMPIAMAGILLCISGPSVLIAWFKLHQRNLGPILDATGWAVNARAKLNIPFGSSLTSIARLPESSSQFLDDPYAEKVMPWKRFLLLLFVIIALLAYLKIYWTN